MCCLAVILSASHISLICTFYLEIEFNFIILDVMDKHDQTCLNVLAHWKTRTFKAKLRIKLISVVDMC